MTAILNYLDPILSPMVVYGTLAVGFVVITTMAFGALVAMIAELLPDDIRRFKRWCRETYTWVKENAPAWRDQVYAWRHRTFRRMWV